MKFRFSPAVEAANPANLPMDKGAAGDGHGHRTRPHGYGFAQDSHGFAQDSHAETRMDKGDSRNSRDSHDSRPAHTEKSPPHPALEASIRAMARRWGYDAEDLGIALAGAKLDPAGWLAVVEANEALG